MRVAALLNAAALAMENCVSPSTPSSVDPLARRVLSDLPAPAFAFAYGSGVFPQIGVKAPGRRMLDLVIAVDNAEQWHNENMERNPDHYPWYMRLLGSRAVARVQRSSFGARLYYNTLMGSGERHFKYGVITVDDMLSDLRSWRWMYIAGRTQKPIRVLALKAGADGLAAALEDNVSYATTTAVLTLSARFSEEEIYTAAASLSYTGDVRMAVAAEVVSKVPSIVKANMPYFRDMYSKPLSRLPGVFRSKDGSWRRDVTPAAQKSLLRRLPQQLKTELKSVLGQRDAGFDAVAERLGNQKSARIKTAVVAAVGAIVTRSSLQQSVKGILTAGAGTSARYAAAKLSKSLAGRLKALSFT